jgi:hypothetical protein
MIIKGENNEAHAQEILDIEALFIGLIVPFIVDHT